MTSTPRLNQTSVSARNAAAIARAAAAAGGGTLYHESPQALQSTDAGRSHWEWAFQALEKRHFEVVGENEKLFAENQKLHAALRDAHGTINHLLSQGQAQARKPPDGQPAVQQHERHVSRPRAANEEPAALRMAYSDDDWGLQQTADAGIAEDLSKVSGGGAGGFRKFDANVGIGMSAGAQQSPRHGRRAGQAPLPPAQEPPPEPPAAAGLDYVAFRQIMADHDPKFYTEAQLKQRFQEMSSGASKGGGGVDEGDLRLRIFLEALSKKAPKVIAWLRTYDTNNDQKIDKREFKKACKELGLDSGLIDLGSAFDALDEDGSGVLTYKELNERLKPSTVSKNKFRSAGRAAMAVGGKRRGGAGGGGLAFSGELQEGVPIAPQLVAILNQNSARVIDLFRRFDKDGNGEVTRKEMRAALVEFGLADVSDEDLSSLWRELDPNGDGALTIREMTTALRASAARATEQDSRCGRPQWAASKLKAVAAFSSRSGWA